MNWSQPHERIVPGVGTWVVCLVPETRTDVWVFHEVTCNYGLAGTMKFLLAK